MNLHGWGALLVCGGGIYLTLRAYGWLPRPSKDDDEEDEDNNQRKNAILQTMKVIGPLTAMLALLRFLFTQPS